MSFYNDLKTFKKDNGLTWKELAQVIGKSQDALQMAIKRESLSKLEEKTFADYMKNVRVRPTNVGVGFSLNEQKQMLDSKFANISDQEVIDYMILHWDRFKKVHTFKLFKENLLLEAVIEEPEKAKRYLRSMSLL